MAIVDIRPIRDLVLLSEKDSIQTYISLIRGDLDRHYSTLKSGIQQSDKRMRAEALHGIYQVAASFGLSALLQITGSLQQKNSEDLSEIEQQDMEVLQTMMNESLDYIHEQDGKDIA